MNRQTQTEIATTLQEHGRIMARVRKAVVTDDSPLTVELGGDEVPASIVHGAAAGIGDIVDVLVAGNRPPLVLAGGGLSANPAARVYNNANIPVTHATHQVLTFNSERYDNDSIHSTSSNTGRLTATTAGVYHITANIRFASNATGAARALRLRVNGSTLIALANAVPVAVGYGQTEVTIVTDWKFAANDYVEVTAFQDSGGSLNVESGNFYSPEFSMHKVSDG